MVSGLVYTNPLRNIRCTFLKACELENNTSSDLLNRLV